MVVVANDKGYEPMLEHARSMGFAVRQVGHGRAMPTFGVGHLHTLTSMSPQLRPGCLSDKMDIDAIDEFGGSRLREIEAGCLFVAIADGNLVGYVSYEPRGLLGQPLLTYLCVHKEHRRQGIATALVQLVQRVAKGRWLISSTEDWCVGTQGIFEQLGWQCVGKIACINKDGSDELFFAISIDA